MEDAQCSHQIARGLRDCAGGVFHQAFNTLGQVGTALLCELPELFQRLRSQFPVRTGTGQENTLEKEVAAKGPTPFDTSRRIDHGLGNFLGRCETSYTAKSAIDPSTDGNVIYLESCEALHPEIAPPFDHHKSF